MNECQSWDDPRQPLPTFAVGTAGQELPSLSAQFANGGRTWLQDRPGAAELYAAWWALQGQSWKGPHRWALGTCPGHAASAQGQHLHQGRAAATIQETRRWGPEEEKSQEKRLMETIQLK